MSLKYYIDSRELASGESPIRVSACIKGVRVTTSTGCKVRRSCWNAKTMRAKEGKRTDPALKAVNMRLVAIQHAFIQLEGKALFMEKAVTRDIILAAINKAAGRESKEKGVPVGVADALDAFLMHGATARAWTVATLKLYGTLRSLLKQWKKSVTFSDFSDAGLTAFTEFLRRERGVRDSTLLKHFARLKAFLSWADECGYLKDKSYKKFKVVIKKNPDNEVVYLEWEELMRFYKMEIPASGSSLILRKPDGLPYPFVVEDASGLEKTRDVFCFCAFTSLRYSDAQNLKWSNVNYTPEGVSILVTAIKTGSTMRIALNSYALQLLEKYKARDFGGYVLPRITNQRMNVYLKLLGEMCGINTPVCRTYYRGAQRIDDTRLKYEFIGTHTARRTFICNALMLGIPAHVVMKWTGHSDYDSMKPYLDVAESDRITQMKKFDQKMI